MMTPEAAKQFCDRWLPAWSGNQPELLASFYSEDALYSDPAIRDGMRDRVIDCIGVCTVQFNADGLIRRNEVYFDRSELLAAMKG